jgi:hypothetical protein
MREALFPDFDVDEGGAMDGDGEREREYRPRKRRKRDGDGDGDGDEDCVPAGPPRPSSHAGVLGRRDVILENDVEQYLLSRCTAAKERTRAMGTADGARAGGGGRRYALSVFPRSADARGAAAGPLHTPHAACVGAPDAAATPYHGPAADPSPTAPDSHPSSAPLTTPHDASTPARPTPGANEQDNTSADAAAQALSTPPLPQPPRHVCIAHDLDEGDMLFLPDGIRISRAKVVGELARGGGGDDGGKLGWFVKVARWKWREAV